MILILCLFAVLFINVQEIKGLKTSKFLSGNAYVEKVCAQQYRVFTRVGVLSPFKCAFECSETIGCDAIFFSAVNGSCTGCRKLIDMSSALVASTANVYYQLANGNFNEWHNGTSRYLLGVNITMNYADAKVYCQLFGAHVAVPDRQGEQDFLTARLSTTPAGVSGSWIGITDAKQNNTYLVERSGEMVNYTCWAAGEPNDENGSEPCTVLRRIEGWKWVDVPCTQLRAVICETY